jgi:hypothetical protein
MTIRLLLSATFVFLLNTNSFSQSGQQIEQNFLGMRQYTVALGTVVDDSILVGKTKILQKKFVPVGSGLLSYAKYDTIPINNIVTAGHVMNFFRNNNLSSIFIRPSWADTIKTTDYFGIEIPLINPDATKNYFLYPDENIDLGCILMFPRFYDDVYINKFSKESIKIFPFVESDATYGNSGGPVFALHEKIELVGIIVGGYPELDSVYINNKPVLDPNTRQALLSKSRSGVSIIEKAEYVKKLIEYVEKEINRNK